MAQGGRRLALSFSGSGLLLVYQLGVLARLRGSDSWPAVEFFAGSSGGSIVATVAAVIPHRIQDFLHNYALHGRAMQGLETMLPADAHTRASGRTGVSMTECGTGRNFLTTKFESRDSLLDAIRASCHLPASSHPLDLLLSSGPHLYPADEGKLVRGVDGAFCDGGFSAFIPDVSGHQTLRVSAMSGPPMDGEMFICRPASSIRLPGSVEVSGTRIHLSTANLTAAIASVSGRQDVLRSYYAWGAEDCDQFLKHTTL